MRHTRLFCFVFLAATLALSIANALAAMPCPSPGGVQSQKHSRSGATCAPKFSYQRQDQWAGECRTGQHQSPINISNAVMDPALKPLDFTGYKSGVLTVFNDCNHYRVQVIAAQGDQKSTLVYNGRPYTLMELHFHDPAENTINGGAPAKMEIHLVHAANDNPNDRLVVAVLVNEGNPNSLINTVWGHIPARGVRRSYPSIQINARELLPDNRGFYTFVGSLTTPECDGNIAWFVLKDPTRLSKAQIDRYKLLYSGTARDPQPVNGREIKQTK